MFDPDEEGCADDMDLQLGEEDYLDDILNSLMDESNGSFLNVKSEGSKGTKNSSSISKRSSGSSSSASNNKKRKYNPDAEKIAEVTEAALRSLDIDPNSTDAKKKRRQIRNRLSAQFHRDRKNAYIKELEDASEVSKKLIETLKKRVSELEQENLFLKDQLGFYHPTTRSESTGNTTIASETDFSSNGSSPLHQPAEYNTGLNSIREITPTRFSTGSTLPIPMAKTLSLLSVLCILCMTYLEHPIKLEPSSPLVDMTPAITPSRRRLEALPASRGGAREEVLTFTSVGNNDSFLHNPYLRGTKVTDNATSSNPRITFSSNALIPFDLPYQYQNDWYARKDSFDALSYSHIVMKSGVALFDPSMKFKQHPQRGHAQIKDTNPMAIVPTISHNPFEDEEDIYENNAMQAVATPRATRSIQKKQQLPQLDYDQTKAVMMDVNESKEEEDHQIQEKHWPALTAPAAVVPHYMADHHSMMARTLEAPGAFDCARCPQDETLLLAKLLEQANLVTVTVPATSVKVGKNVQDSEDGTVEGIMEMFNLSADMAGSADRNQTAATATVFQSSLNDASVEINCIILSAKLIMNNVPQKH